MSKVRRLYLASWLAEHAVNEECVCLIFSVMTDCRQPLTTHGLSIDIPPTLTLKRWSVGGDRVILKMRLPGMDGRFG